MVEMDLLGQMSVVFSKELHFLLVVVFLLPLLPFFDSTLEFTS